jgi:hypothetical protein
MLKERAEAREKAKSREDRIREAQVELEKLRIEAAAREEERRLRREE